MKLHANAGKRTARFLCIALSVMLIVTMIPLQGRGRVYAEPETNPETQGSPAYSHNTTQSTDEVEETEENVVPAPLLGTNGETEYEDVKASDPLSEYWIEESQQYSLPSGTYKLTEDYQLKGRIYIGYNEEVTIDLNGKTLKGYTVENQINFGGVIANDGTLTVKNGTITGGRAKYGGGIYNYEPGVFNVENVTRRPANFGTEKTGRISSMYLTDGMKQQAGA